MALLHPNCIRIAALSVIDTHCGYSITLYSTFQVKNDVGRTSASILSNGQLISRADIYAWALYIKSVILVWSVIKQMIEFEWVVAEGFSLKH